MPENLNNSEEMTDENIIKEFVREIGENPNFYNYIVGLIYSNEGKFTNAINHLKKYLEKEPNDYHANFLLGKIYIQRGQFQKAYDR
ncbi:MAG: tetratricopeptide repeat protein, partial [bacterium]